MVSWAVPTGAVRNVGRGRSGQLCLDSDNPHVHGHRCRAHHWAVGLQSN
jgi:hypothetical protein